jgi:phosphopantothenoylcysteine decarboxylase/phosphopantothenate--cysteine ligase
MNNVRLLLGITGGIAAYKTPELIRLFRAQGAEVRVVMTQSAAHFVTPLTLQTVSEHPVYQPLYLNSSDPMEHITLARWATHILIAPLSANTLAKLALGLCDDLLSTLALASQAPLFLAPAMNRLMWEHSATQTHIAALKARGATFIGPGEGLQACGEIGLGRMSEPADILSVFFSALTPSSHPLHHQKIVITIGPTHEPLDPVRFLGNRSSGKMGFALAEALQALGASVTAVVGPTTQPSPTTLTCIPVQTALEMYDVVMEIIPETDMFIAAAAVSDYRPTEISAHKIKKTASPITFTLTPNPDILKAVCQLPNRPFCVGFAAETEHAEQYAEQKRLNKGADVIILNQIDETNPAFGADTNHVTLFWEGGRLSLPSAPKRTLAVQIGRFLCEHCATENIG